MRYADLIDPGVPVELDVTEMSKEGRAATRYGLFDPTRRYNPLEPLYAERFCTCGMIRRMRAYAQDLVRFVAEWDDHLDQPGHGACDRTTAFLASIHIRIRNGHQLCLEDDPEASAPTIGDLAAEANLALDDAEDLAAWYLAVEAERLSGVR